MRATVFSGALFALGLAVSPALAQYVTPVYGRPIPWAPDACCGGFYTICPDGTGYGPNYYLRPPVAPYQGPGASFLNGGGPWNGPQQPQFRYHPYVRSPRDFFMWGDMMEEHFLRERRPALVP